MKRIALLVLTAVAFTACELPTDVSTRNLGRDPGFNLVVAPADLVGHWGFDEGTGPVAADGSGNGNAGTLINGPTWTTGRSGTALAFDGVDDHVLILDQDALDMVGDFTIALWVKWADEDDADLVRKGSSSTASTYYKIEVRRNTIRAALRGNRAAYLSDTQTRNDGSWHHVALLREGSTHRLYVDGTQVDSDNTSTGDLSNSANLAFGAMDTGDDDFFGGALDDIRFFGRALTDQEINSLLNPIQDDTPPTVPQDVTAVVLSAVQIRLSWSAASDPESGVNIYNIYRNNALVGQSIGLSYTDSGLSPSTTYVYEVSAVNGAGLASARGGPVSATTSADNSPPTAPGELETTPLSAFAIQLSWDVSSDPESGVSHYRIYRDDILVGESVDPSFTDSGLTPSTTYVYEVSAVNGAGLESSREGPELATTLADDPGGGDEGIVAHWDLNDGTGTMAADASGNWNHGILINGPRWVPGRWGTALSFDGEDDYVRILDDDALDLVGDFTLSAWVNWSNDADADIVRKGSAKTSNTWYKIEIKYNRIKAVVEGRSRRATLFDIQNRNDGKWHHVALLRDGSQHRLYVDGELVDSKNANTGDLSNSANLAIGAKDTGTSDFIDGLIDEVRIYDRAVTDQEISSLANGG